MARDRLILWALIGVLALLIIGEIAGNGMINHWNAEGDKYSKPDPAAVKMLSQ